MAMASFLPSVARIEPVPRQYGFCSPICTCKDILTYGIRAVPTITVFVFPPEKLDLLNDHFHNADIAHKQHEYTKIRLIAVVPPPHPRQPVAEQQPAQV